MVVYDITSRRSFTQLSKWMSYIETHATADVSIMLLGCKNDLEEYREVEYEDAKKVKSDADNSVHLKHILLFLLIIIFL